MVRKDWNKKQLDKFYKINPNIKEKDFNLLLRATKTKIQTLYQII